MSTALTEVGLVGLGLVGTAYARLLAQAGFSPKATHRRPADLSAETRSDVSGLLSLEQLATQCRVIVICVYSTEQVVDVLGQLARLARTSQVPLATVMCAATLDPQAVDELYLTAEEARLNFVEYPVSGTSTQIRAGDGVGLLSGAPDAIEAQRDLIDILTPRSHVLGGRGAASLAKLAINLVLEVNRSALAEGLVFAQRVGLNPSALMPALRDSAAYSRVMDGKAPKMLSGDFTAEGRAAQSLKDVELMIHQAAQVGQKLPLADTQADILRAAVEAGDGEKDSSVVLRTIASMSKAI